MDPQGDEYVVKCTKGMIPEDLQGETAGSLGGNDGGRIGLFTVSVAFVALFYL
jgi:hypothetical protein